MKKLGAFLAAVVSYVVIYFLMLGVGRSLTTLLFGQTFYALGVVLDATLATLVAVLVFQKLSNKK